MPQTSVAVKLPEIVCDFGTMARLHLCLMIFAVVALSVLQTASALKCYHCSTIDVPACKDPFQRGVVPRECTSTQVCVKYKTPIILTTNRGCQEKNFCQDVKEFSEHCSECTTDLCNSAPVVIPSLTVIGLIVLKNFLL